MALVVQKYGGACLATRERIGLAADRVAQAARAGDRVVAVVSARGSATDELLAEARALSAGAPPREVDALLSTGELASSALLAIAIGARGVPAVSLGPHQCGIFTTDDHGHARVRAVDGAAIRRRLDAGTVVVVAGFIGIDAAGDVTTLGRGGTDKTAVVLAHVLAADRCEVYKDVAGLSTADPKIVPEARLIPRASFDEMLELSATGAKILQADAVEIAKRFGVPIHIRPQFADGPGTRVEDARDLERADVSGCTLSRDEAIVTLTGVPDRPGQITRIFETIAARRVNVDTILVSPSLDGTTQVSFSTPRGERVAATAACESLRRDMGFTGLSFHEPISKVSVVGVGMQQHPGVAARLFRALSEAHVNVLAVTTSEIKITCAVAQSEGEKALRAVHTAFGLDRDPPRPA